MIAEMLAAGLDANCGGRNYIGITVEKQITRWAAELFGLPETSSGLFVTGTSMANFPRPPGGTTSALGDASKMYLRFRQLTAYTSEQVYARAAGGGDVGN